MQVGKNKIGHIFSYLLILKHVANDFITSDIVYQWLLQAVKVLISILSKQVSK